MAYQSDKLAAFNLILTLFNAILSNEYRHRIHDEDFLFLIIADMAASPDCTQAAHNCLGTPSTLRASSGISRPRFLRRYISSMV